jgi:hypothetical protein
VVTIGVIAACIGCDSSMSLHVVGNRLLNGQGQPIRLLGVNRSGAEYACLHGQGFFAGPTNRRAIAAMAAWNINAVRIPLNEACWLGINGAPARYSGRGYRAAVRAYVARLHRAGLYVVLDLHWNAPGTELATGQQPMADLDHAPSFWRSVAGMFRNDPAVAFDLYNEPYDVSWRCWRDGCLLPSGWRAAGMQTLLNAVRSTGATQPVILAGRQWDSDFSSWLEYRPRDPANALVAGFHVFDFSPCMTARCWDAQLRPLLARVPVIATELGQRACSSAFIERFMKWADAADVSYLGWSWNPTGCAAPALIRSWSGEPTAAGYRLRTHLATAAIALRMEAFRGWP